MLGENCVCCDSVGDRVDSFCFTDHVKKDKGTDLDLDGKCLDIDHIL